MSDRLSTTTKKRQNLDSTFNVSPFQTRSFGVQQKAEESAPASKAELWENYQQAKQLSQKGTNVSTSALPIQAKLTIGQPGDKYEQEADSMAAQVMQMSEPGLENSNIANSVQTRSIQPIQRACAECQEEKKEESKPEEEGDQIQAKEETGQTPELTSVWRKLDAADDDPSSSNLEDRLNGSKGGGSPLTDEVRGFMEPRFGADFSGVRVHTGSDAVQMNGQLNAQAFAHGSDIYFGAGKSPGNNELTAHELTHVVQQTGQVQSAPGGSPDASAPANSSTTFTPNNTTREVHGATLSQVYDSMTNSGAREAASVQPVLKPAPQYEYNEKDKVTKVAVTVVENKEMPSWAELDKQCPPIKNEWNRFYGVLDKHEDKHVEIDRKHFTDVHKQLVGKPRETAWAKMDAVVEAADKENQVYDVKTNHGLNEGTKINGAVQCGIEKVSTEPGDSGLTSDMAIPESAEPEMMAKRRGLTDIIQPDQNLSGARKGTVNEWNYVVQHGVVDIQNVNVQRSSASVRQAGTPDLQCDPVTRQDIHAKIAALVRAPDPMEVIRIMDLPDFSQAKDNERLSLIRIVNQFGGGDPNRLARLWSSFGEGRVPDVAAANMPDWEKSVSLWAGLPDSIPVVPKTEQAFRTALQKLGEFNLVENEKYVQARMEQMGFAQGATKPLAPEEMNSYRQNVQKIASNIWQIRQDQKKARQIKIGSSVGRMSLPVTFDPSGPRAYEGPAEVDVSLWTKIKAEWDEGQKPIIQAAAEYPEIYELVAQGNDDAILRFSRVMTEDPANPVGSSMNAAQGKGYQSQAKELLVSLADRIHKVQGDLGKLDFLELKPLQERLFASPGRWNHGFDKWVATRAVERHIRDENTMKFLTNMAEGAAALVATFATGGMALAFGAVATGIGVTKAVIDTAEAGQIDAAAKATPKRGTDLVTQAQADAKTIEARAELFAAVIGALFLGGAKGIEFLEGRLSKILTRMVADEALLQNLMGKCPNKKQLIRILSEVNSPSEVLELLNQSGNPAKVEEILKSRSLFRARFAARYSKDLTVVNELKATVPELAKIPTEEILALRGYTAEDYDMINRALRTVDAESEIARLQPYIDTLKSGLEKFPKFQGVVTRTESNTHMLYTKGETITKEAFTSTCGPGGKVTKQIVGNTTLEIESVTGRDIRSIASHPKEAEVLFSPGTKFIVVSKTQPVPGWYKIKLKEIP